MCRPVLGALLTLTIAAAISPAAATPYFALFSESSWLDAMSSGQVQPMPYSPWSDYMLQWQMFFEEGDPYPTNTFLQAQPPTGELYVWGGGGGGGINDPEDAGLVMAWGSSTVPSGSYSSAWVYDYLLDPDLSNSTITTTVTAPQFNPAGSQINVVSLGIRDVTGAIRAWSWNVGPGKPIQWNVPTPVSVNTAAMGLGAATPVASGFANNPVFDITQSQWLIVDENARWVGGAMGIPPPGQPVPRMWNYWQNVTVVPNQVVKPEDPKKWSQPPVQLGSYGGAPLFLGWNEPSVDNTPPLVADDWRCSDGRPVTDIHWWGSFIGWDQPYPPALPIGFHIGIWTDVPADPAGLEPSHPGELIWENYCQTYEWNFAGYDMDPRGIQQKEACFQFNQKLEQDKWFRQDPSPNGSIYWLSISAMYEVLPQFPWGWKTRPLFYQDAAYRILQLTYGWPPIQGTQWSAGEPITWQGDKWDLAFELTTIDQEIPEHELGDAPDSSSNSMLPMTAYPMGGPAGVLANYPTVYAAGSPPFGPIHLQPQAVAWLGPGVSLENEADFRIDQDGLNNIQPPADAPDQDALDDAVQVPMALPPCTPTSFPYTVFVASPTTQTLYVNVWFDWNRDGDWNDVQDCYGTAAPEWAVQNQQLIGLPAGLNVVNTPLFLPWHPSGTIMQPIWMRITLAEKPVTLNLGGGAGPPEGYEYGETEDYYFTPEVPPPTLDFGDAPKPYPTLLADNGARHAIVPGFFLGAAIDAEANGQPSVPANRDDLSGVPDDEDGVNMLWPIIPGLFTKVQVTASAPGWLNGWVDFNRNGSWADPEDQVFSAVPVAGGVNDLRFLTPRRGTRGGPSYARFRLTSAMAVPYDGPADDGEVEDYFVEIRPPAEMKLEFSLDIGSDSELSDPFPTGNEVFDPGDVYWWRGGLLPKFGDDGFKDDLSIFGSDPDPDPPDATVPPATRVPVGSGSPQDYTRYFDLDAVDEADIDLTTVISQGEPVTTPIMRFLSNCIHEPYFVNISYDDDAGKGWPANDVPVTASSPSGQIYGTTARRDEVVGVNLIVGPPPMGISRIYPVADEARVHPNMRPNPDADQRQDDDVDGMDVVWSPFACPFWLFSVDHEASMGLDPADIYQVVAGGFGQVIDGQIHLGLRQGTDVDAFELAFIKHPLIAQEVLAVLFSVNDDDPLTPLDESGGLMPNMIYYSLLNGSHAPLVTRPFEDDIDAITLSPKPLGDRIGLAKQLPLGSLVALSGKVVIADFQNRPDFSVMYIEEEDRSSGIAMYLTSGVPLPVNEGDLVTVFGTTELNQDTELVFAAEDAIVDGQTDLIVPTKMMNRSTGGEAFGQQPGLCNDVTASPRVWAFGLNNVGSLVNTWGRVTDVNLAAGLFWINDGSDLKDGSFGSSGLYNDGICVVLPPLGAAPALDSYVSVTGALLAVPGGTVGDIAPVRVLAPRRPADIQQMNP